MGTLLGRFELHDRLGRGGMGQVFRGVHRPDGAAVAVKVMTSNVAASEEFRGDFRAEVRAVASLDHPAIVRLLDHGEIDRNSAARSDGELLAHTPWLAMELASGGTLNQWSRGDDVLHWADLRSVLLTVLDGLAHAHARGLLHLDLKPANILLCTERDPRPGLKISDFGLARRYDPAPGESTFEDEDHIAGTPSYMAPEQIEGLVRDLGPWTDLYALGCMAFQLACGRVPFGHGLAPVAAAYAHIVGNRGELVPRSEVPAGFEDWLDGLLARDAGRRFSRAADAAAALLTVGDLSGETGPSKRPRSLGTGADQTTLNLDPGDLPTLILDDAETIPPDSSLATGELPALTDPSASAPAVPPDWRRPVPPAPPVELAGAGLALFGLRSVPVVGREEERDRLWAALKQVCASDQSRLAVLRGAAGTGKSRLARWLAERAHEVGAARVVSAVHGELPSPADGVAAALVRHLRTEGLSREKLAERLRRLGDGVADPAVVALLAGDDDEYRFERPEERWSATARVLERLAGDRVVLLWLDDVQWGPDSARMVRWLLERRRDLRLLVVATVRDEALEQRPEEAAAVADLVADPSCEVHRIGPLPDGYVPDLVRSLLPVQPALVRQLTERVAGNPLFAAHLLADLVGRDELEPGPGGAFRLRDPAATRLPAAVQEVWRARLDQLEEGRTEGEQSALELAAALGAKVDPDEWAAACREAGVAPAPSLVDELAAAGLARAEAGPDRGGRWEFAHPLLAETIRTRAGERGHLAAHHAACASSLEARDDVDAGRLGRHYLAAGRYRQASEQLLVAGDQARAMADFGRAAALLRLQQRALDARGIGPGSPEAFHVQIQRAGISRSLGDFATALAAAGEARANASERRDLGDLAYALTDEGRTRLNMADFDGGEVLLHEALAHLEGCDRPDIEGSALRFLGAQRMFSGDVAGSFEPLERAAKLLDALPDRTLQAAYCHLLLAQAAKQAGDLGANERCLAEARRRFTSIGSRLGRAECANAEGELARLRDDLPRAEAGYREALEQWEALDSIDAAVARANLGLVLTVRGRFTDARRTLGAAHARFESEGRDDLTAATAVALLTSVAAGRDWVTWERLLDGAEAAIERAGFVYLDVAREAERAGERALREGAPARAERVWKLSYRQWTQLGRPDDAARVEASLSRARGSAGPSAP